MTKPPKDKIEYFLSQFATELKTLVDLSQSNVVLGGSLVLQLHGLNLGWVPEDLDIIVFRPVAGQISYVCDSGLFQACTDYEPTRSWVREKGGRKLNVILAYQQDMPNHLMTYYNQLTPQIPMMFCNSIDNIIEAKLSYAEGKDKNFLRRKDMQHLINLKNNNFNI